MRARPRIASAGSTSRFVWYSKRAVMRSSRRCDAASCASSAFSSAWARETSSGERSDPRVDDRDLLGQHALLRLRVRDLRVQRREAGVEVAFLVGRCLARRRRGQQQQRRQDRPAGGAPWPERVRRTRGRTPATPRLSARGSRPSAARSGALVQALLGGVGDRPHLPLFLPPLLVDRLQLPVSRSAASSSPS